MNILLDTHVILWSLYSGERIPGRIRELLEDRQNRIFCSTVSLWEIGIKNRKRPEVMPVDPDRVIRDCEETGFLFLSLNGRHVSAERSLEISDPSVDHKDPFDRMLISQAMSEEMLFITHDTKFSAYSYDKTVLI